MKNTDFSITEWTGKFYVSRFKSYDSTGPNSEYLLRNGTLSDRCLPNLPNYPKNGPLSGWFNSKEDAQEAIRRLLNPVPKIKSEVVDGTKLHDTMKPGEIWAFVSPDSGETLLPEVADYVFIKDKHIKVINVFTGKLEIAISTWLQSDMHYKRIY